MRGMVAIQSRREVSLQKGPAIFCQGVIKGQQGQVEFGCYDTKIQPHLTLSSNVDVEWAEKPGKEYQGQPTTQRTITQLYIDGQPIAEARQQGKGWQRNEFKKDTPSIEGQTAAKIVCELWSSDKIKDDDPLVKDLKSYCAAKLKTALKPSAEPEAKAEPKAEARPKADTIEAEFRSACRAAGYDLTTQQGVEDVKTWLRKELNTSLPFSEVALEFQKKAITAMKKEELPF